MTSLKNIKITHEGSNEKIEALIVGAFKDSSLNTILKSLSSDNKKATLLACKTEAFKGERGEYLSVYGKNSIKRIFLYGLGDLKKLSLDQLRSESAKIFNFLLTKNMYYENKF